MQRSKLRKILAYVYMPVFFAIVGYFVLYIALSPIRTTLVAAAKMVLVQTVPTFSTGLDDVFDENITYDEDGNVISGGIKNDNNSSENLVSELKNKDESDESDEIAETEEETFIDESGNVVDTEGNIVTHDEDGNKVKTDRDGNVTTIYKNGDIVKKNSEGDVINTSTASLNNNTAGNNSNNNDNNNNVNNNSNSQDNNNSNNSGNNNSNSSGNNSGNNNSNSNTSSPDLSKPSENTRYATLVCDRLGINVPLYFGDSDMALLYGAGQYAGSSLPGYGSPILIGGHNTTYFSPLENVAVGDIFKIETNYGLYQYQVTSTSIVKDSDVDSAYSLSGGEQLILYTCYPFVTVTPGTKTQRMFVYANKISGPSMN